MTEYVILVGLIGAVLSIGVSFFADTLDLGYNSMSGAIEAVSVAIDTPNGTLSTNSSGAPTLSAAAKLKIHTDRCNRGRHQWNFASVQACKHCGVTR
jgi:hypothetical protein